MQAAGGVRMLFEKRSKVFLELALLGSSGFFGWLREFGWLVVFELGIKNSSICP